MIKQITLTDDEFYLEFNKKFDVLASDVNDISIIVYTSDNESVIECLRDKESFQRDLENEREFIEDDVIDILNNNFDHLFDLVEYIKLDIKDDIKYLANNPVLKNKKIVVNEELTVTDRDKLNEIVNKYSKCVSELYVMVDGNKSYVSVSDAKFTIDIMSNYINEINRFNMSPLERVMYAYDLVKERVYNVEGEHDSVNKSRDLSNVLMGDKIVCVGYAAMFSNILNSVGLRSFDIVIENKETKDRHIRNILYIKDDKYNVDGIYSFDTTWDSKRVGEGKKYINRYKFFAKTMEQMFTLESNLYTYQNICYSSDMYEFIKKSLDSNDEVTKFKILNLIDKYYLMVNKDETKEVFLKKIINNSGYDELLESARNISLKINNPLNAETFLKLVTNVRKYEYYLHPEKYSYDTDSICVSCLNSGFEFENHLYNPAEKLLMSIFENYNNHDIKKDLINYYIEHNNDVMLDIERLNFTKILKNIKKK